jgi:hypothetical protein
MLQLSTFYDSLEPRKVLVRWYERYDGPWTMEFLEELSPDGSLSITKISNRMHANPDFVDVAGTAWIFSPDWLTWSLAVH